MFIHVYKCISIHIYVYSYIHENTHIHRITPIHIYIGRANDPAEVNRL
jgi:hypothetical protein